MKGYTEGEVHPGDIASVIDFVVDYIRRDGTLKGLDMDIEVDDRKVRKFVNQSFDGWNHLESMIDYTCDRYLGNVIVPGDREPRLYSRILGDERLPKSRSKEEVETLMENAERTITSDEIVDDIERELRVTAQLGDVEGFSIDTSLFIPMIENDPEGWKEVLELMRHTTDQFIGDIIVPGSQGVKPWPRRSV